MGILLLCLFVPAVSATITISASGTQSYYLGDDVIFSGTNDESTTVYLFLVGPNLPANGAQIASIDPKNNPVVNLHPETFKAAPVATNTWSWTLATGGLSLDAGTYTVYALTTPNDKNNLGGTSYSTVSIIIKKPFTSGTTTRTRINDDAAIVFIGEQGLDASPVMGSTYQSVAWWANAADRGTTAPSVTVSIPNPTYFNVSPGNFVGYTGQWYAYNASVNPVNGIAAFIVRDPTLDLVIQDFGGADVTDTTVKRDPTGPPLTFGISTNMATITSHNRVNVGSDSDANIDINITGPDGQHYFSVFNYSDMAQPLTGLVVDSGSYRWDESNTVRYWNLISMVNGNYRYPPGTYTVIAESTLNGMRDNYKNGGADYTGKTVSVAHTITLSEFPQEVRDAIDTVTADSSIVGPDISKVSVSASPIPMISGHTVSQWDSTKPSFSSPCDGSFVFVDMAPGANWEHPVKYVFVCKDGTTNPHDARSPPSVPVTYAAGKNPGVGDVVWTPQDPYVWTPTCTNDCSNNYALLIDGGKDANNNFVRYWNDVAFMYIALKEYGYPVSPTSQITVMMSDGSDGGVDRCIAGYPACTQTQNSPLDLDGDGTNEAVLDAYKTTILNKLDSWKPASSGGTSPLPNNANLLIFITGHGGDAGGGTQYFYPWDPQATGAVITDAELNLKLDALTQVNSITLVMENCNSGGFASEFLAGNPNQKRRIMYAAAADEPSWGNGFSDALTTGYTGHTRYYTRTCTAQSCSAELNKGADTSPRDERVSASEALGFARLRDPYYTSSPTPVAGKERSNMEANPLAQNDATTLYLSACSGSAAQSITVRSPALNDVWYAGTERVIKWDAPGMANRNVKITLFNGSTAYKVIAASVAATNPTEYAWTIPNDGSIKIYTPLSAVYKVKIEDAANANVNGFSPVFKIDKAPTANGNLKIVAQDRDNPATYLGASYKVISKKDGSIPFTGIIPAPYASGVTTGPYLPSAQGDYLVSLTLDTPDKYYPVDKYPASVGTGTTTVTIPMGKIPKDINGQDTDTPPYGGIDVSSSPAGALIYAIDTAKGSQPTLVVGQTDQVVYLPPATYNVQVKKSGFLDSAIRNVNVVSLTNDRVPVKMYFELPPAAPTLDPIVVPADPVKVNIPVTVSSRVTNFNPDDTYTGLWGWGDSTPYSQATIQSGGTVGSNTHTYTAPGVYRVNLTVTAGNGLSTKTEATTYIVVYDPTAGYVLGAGEFNSPAGAYAANPSLTGRAYFGFESKYVKGKTAPQGITDFYFPAARMNFLSYNYDWLVVTSPKAVFKGTGKINGQGNYRFVLSSYDGGLLPRGSPDRSDKFRIKIYNASTGAVAYDTQPGAVDDADPTLKISVGFITSKT